MYLYSWVFRKKAKIESIKNRNERFLDKHCLKYTRFEMILIEVVLHYFG
jgi:hypothetical protein